MRSTARPKQAKFVHHFREEKGKRKGRRMERRTEDPSREDGPPGTAVRAHEAEGGDDRPDRGRPSRRTERTRPRLHAEALAVFEELHDIIPIFEAERPRRGLQDPSFWATRLFAPLRPRARHVVRRLVSGLATSSTSSPAPAESPRPTTADAGGGRNVLAREMRFFPLGARVPRMR